MTVNDMLKKYNFHFFWVSSDKMREAHGKILDATALYSQITEGEASKENIDKFIQTYLQFVQDVKNATKPPVSYEPDEDFMEAFRKIENVTAEELRKDVEESLVANIVNKNEGIRELDRALNENGIPIDLESVVGLSAFYEINAEGHPVPVYNSAEEYISDPDKLNRIIKYGTLAVLDPRRSAEDGQAYPRLVEVENGKISIGDSIDKIKDERMQKCVRELSELAEDDTNISKLNEVSHLSKAYEKYYKEIDDHGLDYEKVRENNFSKVLKKAEIKIDSYDMSDLTKNGKLYIRGAEKGTVQAVEIDSKTKRITIGKPMEKPKAEPKKPGFFKRLLHGINKNLFKTEFDNYKKEKDAYDEATTAFEKVEVREQEKAREAELKADIDKIDAIDKSYMENYRQGMLEKENKTEVKELSLAGRLDLARYKANLIGMSAEKYTGGNREPLRAGDTIKEIKEALAENKPFDAEKARTCMAKLCMIDMVIRGAEQDPEKNAPIADAVGKELLYAYNYSDRLNTKVAEQSMPIMKGIMNSPAFQNYTKDLTADKLAGFVNDTEFVKLNRDMAKERQAKQNTPETEKQNSVQKQKQSDTRKVQGP